MFLRLNLLLLFSHTETYIQQNKNDTHCCACLSKYCLCDYCFFFLFFIWSSCDAGVFSGNTCER
uniref:Uncharacterized protein n=1 Tax=Anopheles minimus TaxID=112268 RepID=A0A182WNN1_9DIPT